MADQDPDVLTEDDGTADDTGGASQADLDYAKLQGWVPRSEWKGAPEKWTDAKPYAETGRQLNRVLVDNNRRLLGEVDQLKKDITEIRNLDAAKKKEEIDALETELRAARRKAVEDSDGEAFDLAEKGLAAVVEARAKLPAPRKAPDAAATSILEAAEEWKGRNPWVETDEKKGTLAAAVMSNLLAKNPALKAEPKKLFEQLDTKLAEDYPEMFGKKGSRTVTTKVGDGAPGGGDNHGAPKEKGYKDLPKEARETADRFEKLYKVKKEDYAKNYFADQAKKEQR